MSYLRKFGMQPTTELMEEISKVVNHPARSFIAHIDREELVDDLARLVSYPSCSFEGFDIQPSLECAAEVARMVEAVGFADVELIDVGGRAPVVWAEHRADETRYPDAPTLLLYAHYDVQPAPVQEQGWRTDPYVLTKGGDGRYYGRGAADDKSGIVAHLHAIDSAGGLEALDYVNLKICFEGEEECLGTLEEYVATDPQRFAADAYLIFDLGNIEVGKPMLTSALRGTVIVDVEVAALRQEIHSGVFGGPAPDALKALIMLLATLWDAHGNTVIEGISDFEWTGGSYPEELFRRDVGLVEGADLVGTGSIENRLFSRPSASIIGLDATPVAQSSNVVIPRAKARVSVRFPHGQTAAMVTEAVITHLTAHAPAGVVVTFPYTLEAGAFAAHDEGNLYTLFARAMSEVFGVKTQVMGSGASIPLVAALQKISPQADIMLYGASDLGQSNIHGGNESVDLSELVNMIKSEALFLHYLRPDTDDIIIP